MKHKRSTFRRHGNAPRRSKFVWRYESARRDGPGQWVIYAKNRGTGEGTARAMAREAARG